MAVIMSETGRMAAVRSTILFGDRTGLAPCRRQRISFCLHEYHTDRLPQNKWPSTLIIPITTRYVEVVGGFWDPPPGTWTDGNLLAAESLLVVGHSNGCKVKHDKRQSQIEAQENTKTRQTSPSPFHAAERRIVSDHRCKEAIDEGVDAVMVMMSGIRMLAVVRSTILLGESMSPCP